MLDKYCYFHDLCAKKMFEQKRFAGRHLLTFESQKLNQRFSRACIVRLVIKRNNWSYVKTMSCSGSHLGITINIKNTKFVKDLPMIDAQFRYNQCNSFREEYISVFSPYGPMLIYVLRWWPSWISDRHKKHNPCRGPSNDHSWAVWFQLSKWFQRRSVLKHFSHRVQC